MVPPEVTSATLTPSPTRREKLGASTPALYQTGVSPEPADPDFERLNVTPLNDLESVAASATIHSFQPGSRTSSALRPDISRSMSVPTAGGNDGAPLSPQTLAATTSMDPPSATLASVAPPSLDVPAVPPSSVVPLDPPPPASALLDAPPSIAPIVDESAPAPPAAPLDDPPPPLAPECPPTPS